MRKIFLVVIGALVSLLILGGCESVKVNGLTKPPDGFAKPYEDPEDPAEAEEVKVAAGQYYLVNTEPYIRWQPGGEEITCLAGKIFKNYRGKASPGECRLELVVYGGDREKVMDRFWLRNWINNVQTIVNPTELNNFFQNLDPNDCEWDKAGNGDYHRWCEGDFSVPFIGWGKEKRDMEPEPAPPEIQEENLVDNPPNGVEVKKDKRGRTVVTLTEGALLFDVGKWDIHKEYLPLLKKIAEEIQQYSGPVVVVGHTDNLVYKSKAMNNQGLSEKRAHAVANALIDCGVDPKRIITAGYGDRRPKAGKVGSQTPDQRRQNRRVEIIYDGKTVGK